MQDPYYDDDDRGFSFVLIPIGILAIGIACAILLSFKREYYDGVQHQESKCFDEMWRAEDIRPGHSCRQNQTLVAGQYGDGVVLVKCICN